MQPEIKQDVVRRLKTVQGHVAGLSRMVEEDKYCIDVLDQVVAVQRSLDQVALKVLDGHLNTCVKEALSGGAPEDKDRIIQELLTVYKKAANL